MYVVIAIKHKHIFLELKYAVSSVMMKLRTEYMFSNMNSNYLTYSYISHLSTKNTRLRCQYPTQSNIVIIFFSNVLYNRTNFPVRKE